MLMLFEFRLLLLYSIEHAQAYKYTNIRTHTRCIAIAFAEHIVVEEHHFLEMSGGFTDICT